MSSDLNSGRDIDLEFDEKSPAPKNFLYFVGQCYFCIIIIISIPPRPRRPPPGAPSLARIQGGPLSYTYTLTHARLHFGVSDQQGSEHLVDNRAFPAEVS